MLSQVQAEYSPANIFAQGSLGASQASYGKKWHLAISVRLRSSCANFRLLCVQSALISGHCQTGICMFFEIIMIAVNAPLLLSSAIFYLIYGRFNSTPL